MHVKVILSTKCSICSVKHGPECGVANGELKLGRNIGLAGCGMRVAGCRMKVKIKTGYGMRGLLMAGCGIRAFRRERDLLLLIVGMRDSFKIDCGTRDKKQKITTLQTIRRELRSNQAGSAYKHYEWGGIAGLTRNEVMAGCGIDILDPPEECWIISFKSLDN